MPDEKGADGTGPGELFSCEVFRQPAPVVARALLGALLLVDGAGGMIVETEAYAPDDPASHSFRGPTPRTAAMFGPPGHAYVYLSYGLHWCLNLVCAPAGSAVLIRSLQPLRGLPAMQARRPAASLRNLCRGPGRLSQALGVTGALDGRSLVLPPFRLLAATATPAVRSGPRIGITRGVAMPWRFCIAGSAFLSRPAPPV